VVVDLVTPVKRAETLPPVRRATEGLILVDQCTATRIVSHRQHLQTRGGLSMKRRTSLVLTSLLAACTVALPAAAIAKPGGTDRPIKGSTTGTTTVDLAALTGSDLSTGVFSHMGKTTVSSNFAIVLPSPTTFQVSGPLTTTAANGDQVFWTCTGNGTASAPAPAVGETTDYTLVCTATGGTGRFSDATGTTTTTGHQEFVSIVGTTATSTNTATTTGRISY
jgi:hypothetical protein